MKQLWETAQTHNIDVFYGSIPHCRSLSLPDHICLDYSLLFDNADSRVCFAHEIGHCVTGSFYNRYTPLDVRQKHENRADRWAVQKLIPVDALDDAVANGYTTLWELAEFFGVTEDFMRKAVCLHTYGNIAEKIYF